jgi:CRP-like cAMP-binding protein
MTMITATLGGAIDIMQFLSIDDPTRRTAACLLALNATGSGWNGALPLSQAEVASIARISRRRINNALAELEAAGIIERGYGVISIRDEAKLRSTSINTYLR